MGSACCKESAPVMNPERMPARWPEKEAAGTRRETITREAKGEKSAGMCSPNTLTVADALDSD